MRFVRYLLRAVVNGLTSLSLLAAIVCAVLWIHSQVDGGGQAMWRRGDRNVDLLSSQGVVSVAAGRMRSDYEPPEGWTTTIAPFDGNFAVGGSLWKDTFMGFSAHHYVRNTATSFVDSWQVQIPWYAATVASLVLPAVWLRRLIRERHAKIGGRCGRCGYDLRGTPERCPECGRTVDTPLAEIGSKNA